MDVQTDFPQAKSEFEPLPGPRPLPLIGNLHHIDTTSPVASMTKIAEKFGPIFKLEMPGQRLIVISSPNLVEEVCDDKRFEKHIHNVLRQIREFAGDGLFTVGTAEGTWKNAHRVVSPAFSAKSMNDYFEPISDIAEQLVAKWAKLGADRPIDVCDDLVRFALDSVALSTLGFRFNSFQESDFHPFVRAMAGNLREAWLRARRPPFLNAVKFKSNQEFTRNTETIRVLARQILNHRRSEMAKAGKASNDLLGRLITAIDAGVDSLSEENVINQIITILIAGHDTTGSLLAFALHALLSHPLQLERAIEEVDKVVGQDKLQSDHLPRLSFLEMVMRESLRLWPPAPTFARRSKVGDTVIGKKFKILASDVILINLSRLQQDPSVWGEGADQFSPERMGKGQFSKLHMSAYKPFGAGQRSCIGATLALRESVVLLALILQKFSLKKLQGKDPLVVLETPALRPAKYQIYASPRSHGDRATQNETKSDSELAEPRGCPSRAASKKCEAKSNDQ